jgi:hypothetical protein
MLPMTGTRQPNVWSVRQSAAPAGPRPHAGGLARPQGRDPLHAERLEPSAQEGEVLVADGPRVAHDRDSPMTMRGDQARARHHPLDAAGVHLDQLDRLGRLGEDQLERAASVVGASRRGWMVEEASDLHPERPYDGRRTRVEVL